ncbi:MAG: AraC family transcriptional regulator [Treponema sp.]|jgi:AraC-like DNA-binding protein|nr:AraC family transcriptional regulator [Treponema sp.]
MKKIPWQEKEEFGFSLPFRCWDSALPEFVFPPHWHEYYELFLVLDGKVSVIIDGYAREALRGDIMSINPGQLHSFPHSERGTRIRFFQFEPGIFSKDVGIAADKSLFSHKSFLYGGEHPDRDALDEALYPQVSGLLADMFTEYREQKKGFRLAIKAKLYLLALAYLRDNPPEDKPLKIPPSGTEHGTPAMADQRMERIYQLIFSDFDNVDLDLVRAAQAAALSPSYFAHFFKEQTGRSFYAYLSTIRISHAVEFLLKTDLPVSLIADKCGFASLPTFHRVFKAETGCTPVLYRKNAKQQ